jgi:formylglycine-generating enzyme required for sulfatase activity
VSIGNETLVDLNTAAGTMGVSFQISWNYSWRTSSAPKNWDAMWVFIKYRRNGGDWGHASLMNSGHTAPSGSTIEVGLRDPTAAFNIASNPGAGIFIYRNTDGFGTNTFNGVKLVWNYAQDGLLLGDSIDFQVHAVHMVYVPAGAFYAGDNNTSTASFRQGSSDDDPWYIGGEGAITTANITGSGTDTGGTLAEYYDATGYAIPAAFPKGYQAMYVMRHEITQEQWRSFFNTLPTGTPRTNRDITGNPGKNVDSCAPGYTVTSRNNLCWPGTGQATLPDAGGNRTFCTVPANFLNWGDVAAWLDWAALRPMTELEFEKAARGPDLPQDGEYAWGAAVPTPATGISAGGFIGEQPSNAGANSHLGNVLTSGPLRVGSFAMLNYGSASRFGSGGSYYGVLELSGNLRERTVTVGNATGRAFTGVHGDGALDLNGQANVTNWPSVGAVGAGFRGGSYSEVAGLARISDRTQATSVVSTTRSNNFGGRGVRFGATPTPTP